MESLAFVTSIRAAWKLYKAVHSPGEPTCVEAGSNTSTVILRVVGGDEKGSLKSETVKYGHESQGTPTRERLPGEGQQHI
jgi:hypothetical protein